MQRAALLLLMVVIAGCGDKTKPPEPPKDKAAEDAVVAVEKMAVGMLDAQTNLLREKIDKLQAEKQRADQARADGAKIRLHSAEWLPADLESKRVSPVIVAAIENTLGRAVPRVRFGLVVTSPDGEKPLLDSFADVAIDGGLQAGERRTVELNDYRVNGLLRIDGAKLSVNVVGVSGTDGEQRIPPPFDKEAELANLKAQLKVMLEKAPK